VVNYLYIEAPFATFRTFTAGWYRPTATFLTPSAAYGLLLNIAGIELRLREEEASHDGKTPASLMRPNLPAVQLALGVPTFALSGQGRQREVSSDELFPRMQTMFQQLHNYPVGKSGQERAEECRGNKYNITPVRREFLSDFRAVVAFRGNDVLAERVRAGLSGELDVNRYGVPFVGDNSFLIDRLNLLESVAPVCWFDRLSSESSEGIRDRTTRLTVQIDRAELSKTKSALFAPHQGAASIVPPETAWVEMKSN